MTQPQDGLCLLTTDLPKFGGKIRQSATDFRVDELPLYEPSGSGTHLYLWIEKQNLTTLDVINALAHRLNIQRRDIGYAGLKDSHAVTRQWLSIEHLDPHKLDNLRIPGLRILQHSLHRNKLKLGHLRGNCFAIRVRHLDEPPESACIKAQAVLDVLVRRGMPNAFGPQRFGIRLNAHQIGRALCLRQTTEAMDQLLGQPSDNDPETFAHARRLYDQGDYEKAIETWPGSFREERYLLRELLRNGGKKGKALRKFNRTLKRFYISAFQSHVFNCILGARMPHLDQLLNGDVAFKHDNGACFEVTDAVLEQPRCDGFDISPTGPMFGKRFARVQSQAAEIEDVILKKEAGDILENPELLQDENLKGSRRPLRVQPRHTEALTGQDDQGDYLEVKFELPPGSYATVLLQEILKPDPEAPLR